MEGHRRLRAQDRSVVEMLSSRYIASRRSVGDLSARLAGVVRERSQVAEAVAHGDAPHMTDRLAVLDRHRGALDRHVEATRERTRAVEALIAAIVLASFNEESPRAERT